MPRTRRLAAITPARTSAPSARLINFIGADRTAARHASRARFAGQRRGPAVRGHTGGTGAGMPGPADDARLLVSSPPWSRVRDQRATYPRCGGDLVTGHTTEQADFPDTLRDHTWTPGGHLLYVLGDTAYLHTPDDGSTQALTGFPPLVNIEVRPASIRD